MIKKIITLIIASITIFPAFCQSTKNTKDSVQNKFSDGPYIFIEKNNLIKKSVINGQVFSKVLEPNAYDTIFHPEKAVYNKIRKIAALSDIHGQYDLAVEILKNNKIIDKKLNWNFGKGHLIIVGDIFDRGDKVNEILWLIYKLENQAKRKGGRVHFLLGNHEYMILHKDLRYINEKYKLTSKLLNTEYDELYGKNTLIGRWLRSKSTILKINNNVFVHGGISKDFLAKNDFNIKNINDIMRKSIDRSIKEMESTDFYKIYYGRSSLIWYRGYFLDKNLKDKDVSDILNDINSEHIVVGHCSHDEVVSLFDNKIFGVDSSIKKGKYGELLLIKKGKYFRGTLEGKKIRF